MSESKSAPRAVGGRLPSSSGAKGRLFRSFGAQFFAISLRVIQQIIWVPVLIKGWGSALYADWLIVFSATGFLSILDFGLQTYFGNALQISYTQGNLTATRRYFAIAMGIYAAILTVATLTLIGIVLFAPLDAWLGTHLMSGADIRWIVGVLGCSILILIPFGVVNLGYRAHGEYSRGLMVAVLAEAARGYGVCVIAFLGAPPPAAATVYLAVGLLFWVAVTVDQKRRYGDDVPFAIAWPTRAEFRETVSRSGLYLTSYVATPVVMNGPILLLGFFAASPTAIVAFSVSRTLASFVRQVVQQLCQAVGPEMVHQEALADLKKLQTIYLNAGRLVSGLAALLGGFTWVAAGIFIPIWTRHQVEYDPLLIGIFILTIILVTPAQVAIQLFSNNNRPLALAVGNVSYALLTAIFCSLLVARLSDVGAATGLGLAEFISFGLLLPAAASRATRQPFMAYLALSYTTAFASFILGGGTAWLLWNTLQLSGIFGLVVLSSAWSCLIAVPSYFLLLTERERRWLQERIRPRLRKFAKLDV